MDLHQTNTLDKPTHFQNDQQIARWKIENEDTDQQI